VAAARASAEGAGAPPPYQLVRHDEDYSYLSAPEERKDALDPIKYIPLSDSRPDVYLSLGGELRERVEIFDNANWLPLPTDAFLLQKYMLSADLHLGPRVRVFTSLKSGLEDGRAGGPRPPDEDKLDVHEAFLDVRLGEKKTGIIRVGRREYALGSQRLVAVRAGLNVRQSFDGVSVIAAPGQWRLEAFLTRPVRTDEGVFDDDPDHTRTFWGVYATGPLRLFEHAGIDVYYMGLDRKLARYEQGTASELRETVGARLFRRPPPWDYNFEVVYQWGRFGPGSIRAWTFASDTGFTLREAAWHPRFGLKADVTSGDQDALEPTLQSFNPLFPKGAYFSDNQLIGPVNHIDLHLSVDLQPLRQVTVSPSWLFFWRQSRNDGLYGVPGNLIRPVRGATARYVGSQPAVMLTVGVGRHLTVGVDWEYFIAGPFLRESGPASNVTYLGSWVTFVF
jgi:alginate export protein